MTGVRYFDAKPSHKRMAFKPIIPGLLLEGLGAFKFLIIGRLCLAYFVTQVACSCRSLTLAFGVGALGDSNAANSNWRIEIETMRIYSTDTKDLLYIE